MNISVENIFNKANGKPHNHKQLPMQMYHSGKANWMQRRRRERRERRKKITCVISDIKQSQLREVLATANVCGTLERT